MFRVISLFALQFLIEGCASALLASVPTTRPIINVSPKTLEADLPIYSPQRNRTCTVKGGTEDDSSAIFRALKCCNNGGHVLLEEGVTYTVGTALNLTFLQHVDIGTFYFLFCISSDSSYIRWFCADSKQRSTAS